MPGPRGFLLLSSLVLGTAAGSLATTHGSRAAEGVTTRNSFDAAGRLVEVRYDRSDGRPRRERFEYDAAGNLLARRRAGGRDLAVSVASKSPGAWSLTAWDDGTVTGYGADASRGFYEIDGTLALGATEVTGALGLRPPAGGAEIGRFVLARSKVKRDGAGEPVRITLRASKTAGASALSATGSPVAVPRDGFSGTFGGSGNRVRIGRRKSPLGAVTFTPAAARPGLSVLGGAVTGTLVRTSSGSAWGTVTHEGIARVVACRLRDGASKVQVRSVKGPAFQFTLERF